MDVERFIVEVWQPFLEPVYGSLVDMNHGRYNYRAGFEALAGVHVYHDPRQLDKEGRTHCTLEITGEGCDCLPMGKIKTLIRGMEDVVKVTRVDLAFDLIHFTPLDVFSAVINEKLVSKVNRHSVSYTTSPFEVQKDGITEGTSTTYLGASSSERRLRVYNQRGFTRLEAQFRGNWSTMVVIELISTPITSWWRVAMGYVRQYVEFDTDWWRDFVQETFRFDRKVSSPRVLSMKRVQKWLYDQVGLALMCMEEVSGELFIEELVQASKQRYRALRARGRRTRYDALLQLV
ncbi:MAG: replication initiation factor domain-containing protein [Anaerolineaceae bacterium]|nr:replication initiation factor domain-containing protein [Anaerolineaceae bacterium]